MTISRVNLNSSEVQSYLDGDHGVREMLEERAQRVLSAAQGNAPVDTGEYVGSLHLETDHTDRLVVRVVADAPHALAVEAATGNLASALDAAG